MYVRDVFLSTNLIAGENGLLPVDRGPEYYFY